MSIEKHILIIDDNVSLCYSLRNIFEDEGYRVTLAHTGAEGLAALRERACHEVDGASAVEGPIHVTLLDIRLPDVQGTELLPAIHEMQPDMPVIMITAYASLETAVQALHLGAYAYVLKPLDMDEVLITVRRALEKLRLVEQEWRLIGQLEQELAERVRAEEQLKEALAEKETLLKEIYHRTKNNLQLVSSLLGLQSGYAKDKEDAEMFRESQNRVKSMAVINEKLYRSADLKQFDFAEYAHSLASHLFRSYDASGIEAIIAVEDIFLDIEQAIPCGLIINELVSNALKYAFPDRDGDREVRVEFRSEGDRYVLIVSDNGLGFPGDLDFRNTESLGLQLVVALTEQLDGHIELDRSSGTIFKITFARKL